MAQEFMAGAPETPKKMEYPKPLTFEELISIQQPRKDDKGQIIEFTQEEKEKMYSGYVGFFYEDLKHQIESYGEFIRFFYTGGFGPEKSYDKKNNPEPMSFDEFYEKNKSIK